MKCSPSHHIELLTIFLKEQKKEKKKNFYTGQYKDFQPADLVLTD